MKPFVRAFLVLIGLVILGGATFVWSGLYSVAANVPHWGVTFWVLDQAKDRSIAFHSRRTAVPVLKGDDLAGEGFRHFHSSCRLCHGAPGYKRLEFATGLYPLPPDLGSQEVQGDLKDAELYWIVKNGLKLTGMPSFGEILSEKDLAGIIAFLRRLPTLTENAYAAMVKTEGMESSKGPP
jgi:mono/diheme cytochrome c family protein